MTIEDLIESSEKCVASVLVRTSELEIDARWFYRACPKCASRITTINGQIYCDKCSLPRPVVPRYKLHVEVIDNTGSTTFVMFDRVVSQVVERSAQSFLGAISEANTSAECPPELKMFVDKRMLFKVKVSDANLYCNWRSYTVKEMTIDDSFIEQFISLHGISLANDEEDVAYVETVCELADENVVENVEGVDSSNKDEGTVVDSVVTPTSKALGKIVVYELADQKPAAKIHGADSTNKDDVAIVYSIVTPTSKPLGKRASAMVESLDDLSVDGFDASTTKDPKLSLKTLQSQLHILLCLEVWIS